ncbi:class I SAM-dependent methyltransferase [Synechococcus sp. A10-1-5-1]|uniref:methyltransferase domain-containing protein n=1 Tax=Synechococcus sp. A10-1-5-1 TaxID=2936507 RepID=UPI0020007E43|nr:methyltransferase domain-containing protein [Synechococcus sp. A10-1-5-1]UPM49274.1 class I SAM-dependent methyltransferase [Synechococcus sp. A10-1-5-1]
MADLREDNLFGSYYEQKKNWYYEHKSKYIEFLISKHFPKSVNSELNCLDIGAGNGIMGRMMRDSLSKRGVFSRWDSVDTEYKEQDLVRLRSVGLNASKSIPSKKYDLILAIDVAEHVNDDRSFFCCLLEHLSVDGICVITVPAFSWLWSSHDIFLKHYRRYTRTDLTATLQACGYDDVDSGFLFSLILPIAFVVRSIDQLTTRTLSSLGKNKLALTHKGQRTKVGSVTSSLLRCGHKLERYLKKRSWRAAALWGVTCYCVAKSLSKDEKKVAYD